VKLQVFHPNFGSFVITPGPEFRVGRSGGDVELEMNWDRLVSREHGKFTASPIGLVYEDLDSANGTWWLHGERLTDEEALAEGDCLILGDTRITVVESKRQSGSTGLVGLADTLDITLDGSLPRPEDPSSISTISLEGYLGASADLSMDPESGSETNLARVRAHPRIPTHEEVWIQSRQGGPLPSELLNVSLGGIYVATTLPIELGDQVSIGFANHPEEIALELQATAVHRSYRPTDPNSAPILGVGLRFLNLTEHQRIGVERLVARRDHMLRDAVANEAAAALSAPTQDDALALASRCLNHLNRNDLYQAINLPPDASTHQVIERFASIQATLVAGKKGRTPSQQVFIDETGRRLATAGKLLCSENNRLAYDFRVGQVRALDRLRDAERHNGVSLETLQTIWAEVHPGRALGAVNMWKRAFRARAERDFVEASRMGAQALELAPFDRTNEPALDAWRELALMT
jgi:pSer/pThr/pTyr-binding forkhead associated (FHA) protein